MIEAGKDDTEILSMLRKAYLLEAEENHRRDDIMHPSEMAKTDWCPRHDYYRMTGAPRNAVDKHGFELQNIFDEGTAIHEKWQTRLWDAGELYGLFECLACAHDGVNIALEGDGRWWDTSPQECISCKRPRVFLVYREIPLFNSELRIGGHADAGYRDALVEMKSIGIGTVRFDAPAFLREHTHRVEGVGDVVDMNGMWRDIKTPFPAHIRQGMLYLWISKKKAMYFIYESKPHQATKEFVVRYRASVVEPILEKAQEVVDAVDAGDPPKRPRWADEDDKTCGACPYFGECFNVKTENEHARTKDQGQEGRARPARQGSRRGGRRVLRGRTAIEEASEGPQRSGRYQRAGSDGADGRPRELGLLLEDQARRGRGGLRRSQGSAGDR